MKIQLLPDIVSGFILLILWLNLTNGELQRFIDELPERFKFSLYSLLIIAIPLLADFAFNSSESGTKTFAASFLTAVIALVVRETFLWYREQNSIKEELFSELRGNYVSLKEFVDFFNTYYSPNKKASNLVDNEP